MAMLAFIDYTRFYVQVLYFPFSVQILQHIYLFFFC